MDRTPRAVWLERIEAWKSSGMTAKEFAAANGFDAKTFQNRKYHFGVQARREAGLVQPKAKARAGFVEVMTSPRRQDAVPVVAVQKPAMANLVVEQFEVHLRNGLMVKVPSRFDANALRQLLFALEAR